LAVRALVPQQVDAQVHGDAIQPGVEAAAAPEPPDDPVQPNEDLLRHVARQLLVAYDVVGDPEDALALALDQGLERLEVALGRTADQLRLVHDRVESIRGRSGGNAWDRWPFSPPGADRDTSGCRTGPRERRRGRRGRPSRACPWSEARSRDDTGRRNRTGRSTTSPPAAAGSRRPR